MKKFVKPSKAVTDGQKLSVSLEAAANEIALDAGRSFDEALVPYLEEGESPPSSEAFRHILLARWLRRSRERLVAADEAHQASIRMERVFRLERDASAKVIESKVRVIRGSIEKVYGEGLASVLVGVAEDIPEDPVVLQRYAGRIIQVMSDPDLHLPTPTVKGSAVQPARLIVDLQDPLIRLEEIFEKLEPQKRKTQIALQEKQDALDALNFANGRIARYLEAASFLGGMDFHAERVRLSSHARPAEDEPPEPPEESAPDGGTESVGKAGPGETGAADQVAPARETEPAVAAGEGRIAPTNA